MSSSDKVIIGGSILMLAAAGTMMYMTKQCKAVTSDTVSRLANIQFTLKQCNDEIAAGNKEIADAGRLLRKLVNVEADKNVNNRDSVK